MLSILIPCYNEETVITKSVNKISEWSKKNNLTIQLIVVNNGSTDSTLEELGGIKFKEEILILNENSKGKGYAIKKGLKYSKYKKVLILDADLSTDINEFNLDWIKKDDVLIIGSRPLGSELNTPRMRKISGFILNLLIQKIFNLKIRDTQCGFKYISSDKIKIITSELTIGGFIYDLDLILLSLKLGLKVEEVAVKYIFDKNSSVSLIRDPFLMLKDIYRINKKYK